MDSDEMIKRINSGEPLIDITINKWKDVANGTGGCLGRFNCALCHEYFYDKCENCPIYKFTGFTHCYKTPFRTWYGHYMEKHLGFPTTRTCPVCKSIANREVEFLEQVKSEAFL
jgi:hypothetical protein